MDPQILEELSNLFREPLKYDYEPLDYSTFQFRILTLFPPTDSLGCSPLSGSLRVASFSTAEYGYEALSYVWGHEKATYPLQIGGGVLPISSSLAEALCYIRHPSKPRNLWIDALCIDQKSSNEKNHQVQQMYKIFSLASRVLIWLGGGDEDSEFALTHLEGVRFASRQDIPCIAKIFDRPWWSRIWTFQEGLAANGKSLVICGPRIVSWQLLLQALRGLMKKARQYPDLKFHQLRYFLDAHTLHRNSQKVSLESLIFASTNRKATNPRDYIYALLGLVNDTSFEAIQPDYTKPVSWAYQQAMVSIIKSRNNLDMLVAKVLMKGPTGIALDADFWLSWCPIFSRKQVFQDVHDSYLNRRFSTTKNGASTGMEFPGVLHDARRGTVTISGTIVSRISETIVFDDGVCGRDGTQLAFHFSATPFDQSTMPNVFRDFVRAITDVAAAEWAKLPNQWTRSKIARGDVWKIMANGRHIEHVLNETTLSNSIYSALETMGQSQPGSVENQKRVTPSLSNATIIEHTRKALARLAEIWTTDMCIIFTDTGYVGSGSPNIQRNDLLCILFGCKLPLVLRQKDDGTYRVIDAVYVDGIMGGEFLQDEAQYTATTFVIN